MIQSVTDMRRSAGSVYVAILGVVTLVSVVGLAGLAGARVQRKAVTGDADAAAARRHARAAIEIGLQLIADDPFWRTTRGAGDWIRGQPIGAGTLSLSVSDPVDGAIADAADDPVLLTGIGTQGDARMIVQVELDVGRGVPALEVSMLAADILKIDSATLNCDQAIGSNNKVEATNGAVVYADALAVSEVKGATFHGAAATGAQIRPIPAASTALSYYLTRGTPISYTDLYQPGGNALSNPGFEFGLAPWYATAGQATLTVTTAEHQSGGASLHVSSRVTATSGPTQDVTAHLASGRTYHVEAEVKRAGSTDITGVRVGLVVTYRAPGASNPTVASWTTPAVTVGSWKKVEGDLTPVWNGSLEKAELRIETANAADSFYVDSTVLTELSADTDRRLRRVLLSPQHNPYGAGQINAEGIYLIDCGGQRVVIEDCRIVGTLVLINPKNTSIVRGSVSWEPAVAGYPALLTDKTIEIGFSDAGLSESTLARNFNPSGSAYPYPLGQSNADTVDAYPSQIRGLIYSGEKLLIYNRPTIEGVVIAADDIEIKATSLTLRYRADHLNSPPPGFATTQRTLQVAPGTWRRAVN